ncbi:MAG: TonB-dependent siderophore receptor [Nitrospirota bacterium]
MALLSLSTVGAAEDTTSTEEQQEQVETLPEVTVKGKVEETGYSTRNATSATKSAIRLLETPQAVSVVTRQLMEDQNAYKLDDVLKNVAGVSHGGYYGEWDYYRIRGFNSAFNAYLDGLFMGLFEPNTELWGLERVEVVKGPGSALYGQGPAGGFVSLISKRPQPNTFGETRLTVGSFNTYEAAFDVNQPLNEKGNVYARLNALYRVNDSFVDYANGQRFYLAPSLTWDITPSTSLTLLTSVTDYRLDFAFPLPARGTVLSNPNGEISTSLYIGNPEVGNDEWEKLTRLGYEFKHRFNEHLSFRNNFRYERNDWTSDDLAYPSVLQGDDRTLELSGWLADGKYQGYRVDTAVDGNFTTGSIEHTLTGGVDFRWTETKYIGRSSNNLVTLDVFTPDYGAMPLFEYDAPFTYDFHDDDLGVYVQEHARFLEDFTATVGGRFDWSRSSDDESAKAFSPRAGLTYEFVDGMAAYANYARSFEPQWGFVDSSGNVVDPATGENMEVGLKASLLDGRLSGLLAVYQLTKQDIATPDLSTADLNDSIVSGEQRSRGVEIEGAYRFGPGWEVLGAYTYMDAQITEDNSLQVGSRLWGVPEHSVNAWTKYTLQGGPLPGLGFGLGGRYYSEQEGDSTYSNPFTLPAYGVVDAAVYYTSGRFKSQVNVNNVFDKRYFVGAYNDVYVLPGTPFNVQASVGWTF